MPESNPPAPGGASAFEIVTPSKSKKGSPKSIIIILLVFVFLAGAIFLGVTLVKQNQNVAEKAAVPQCMAAQQCPTSDGTHLLSCTPPESDNSPSDSLCGAGFVGRIEVCGGAQYCCNGTRWTVSMAACATPTPTATATASATPTIAPLVTQAPTATGTATATATATASSSSTPVPIPATGTGWPTYLGAGIGVFVIIASILLAL